MVMEEHPVNDIIGCAAVVLIDMCLFSGTGSGSVLSASILIFFLIGMVPFVAELRTWERSSFCSSEIRL